MPCMTGEVIYEGMLAAPLAPGPGVGIGGAIGELTLVFFHNFIKLTQLCLKLVCRSNEVAFSIGHKSGALNGGL